MTKVKDPLLSRKASGRLGYSLVYSSCHSAAEIPTYRKRLSHPFSAVSLVYEGF